ncbi:hypothetical protein ACF0H5_008653 [Mactra antiquata]
MSMGNASWGTSSWSNTSKSGSSHGWGNTSWSNNEDNIEPEGTHSSSCIAGTSGWGNSGLMTSFYDEKCSGCRHERSSCSWTNKKSGANPAWKFCALFGIGVTAKKSLWG